MLHRTLPSLPPHLPQAQAQLQLLRLAQPQRRQQQAAAEVLRLPAAQAARLAPPSEADGAAAAEWPREWARCAELHVRSGGALEAELAQLVGWGAGGRLGVWKLNDVGNGNEATVRSYVEAARVQCGAAPLDDATISSIVDAADQREHRPQVDEAFVLSIVEEVSTLMTEIRASPQLQQELLAGGLASFMRKRPLRHEREVVKALLDRAIRCEVI